ncbi:MAG: metallophosphoesterase family protein [Oscillospiraceae bacterium]|jgi:hypothetical protein|nr:metallophosphoesterase family protein [Oscillospiraceae bacterium]
MANELQFKNGKCKIMQITDVQDVAEVHSETIRFIELALDAEQPDLVVFTGDQVKGYAPKVKGRNGPETVRKTIRQIVAPLQKRGIPFTFAFGNHDIQAVAAEKQLEWYRESPLCLVEDTPGLSGVGNCFVPIKGADGNPKLGVYMLDSHGNAGVGGYQPLKKDQVDWYRATREELKEKTGGYVPSLLFMHIPVEEIYRLLRPAQKGEKGIRGFRGRKGTKYVLDTGKVYPDARLKEALCVADENAGLFEAAKEKGEMLGMFFGHDHKNSFAGRVEGIDLGYCPGCGFAVYGDGVNRGVRVFEIDEADPHAYTTRLVTYKDLTGKHKPGFGTWLADQAPTSADDAAAKILPLLGILAVVAAGIVLLVKSCC